MESWINQLRKEAGYEAGYEAMTRDLEAHLPYPPCSFFFMYFLLGHTNILLFVDLRALEVWLSLIHI